MKAFLSQTIAIEQIMSLGFGSHRPHTSAQNDKGKNKKGEK